MSRPFAQPLVVATTNRGKLEELRTLLAGLPVDVRSMAEVLREPPRVVEDGETFSANAVKKALAVAQATMMLTLADDSGLEVDALDGRPGVRSARFAHPRATDAENNAALLAALKAAGNPPEKGGFRARFRCVLALVDPFTGGGEPRIVEGTCEGTVTRVPRGSRGFGYDPLFVVDQTETTMAELSEEEKNRLGHRGRAFAALLPLLRNALAEREKQTERAEQTERAG